MNAGAEPFRSARASSKSQYQFVVQGLEPDLRTSGPQKLNDAMAADRAYFTDVTSDLQNNALQAQLVVDRDKAASLGIDADVLRSTLYGGFGSAADFDDLRLDRQLRGDHGARSADRLVARTAGHQGGGPPTAPWCRSAPSPVSNAPPAR